MKRKTIKKICDAKIKNWIESVTDKETKKAIEEGAFITGGAIASMLMGEPVNDFDVYFKEMDNLRKVIEYYTKIANKGNLQVITPKNTGDLAQEYASILDGRDWTQEDVDSFLDKRYGDSLLTSSLKNSEPNRIQIVMYSGVKQFVSLKEQEKEENMSDEQRSKIKKYRLAYLTSNAITLTDKLQIVIRFHGDPDEVHKNYDFVHATSFYDYKEKSLVIKEGVLESIRTKELKYIGSLYPLTSILRAQKFIKRGWRVSAGTMLKIMYQVSLLDLNNIDVLNEQLVGVDVAYFDRLISELKKATQEDEKVSQGLLFELIEKIFNDDDYLDEEERE